MVQFASFASFYVLLLAAALTVLAAPLPPYVFLFYFEFTQTLMIFLFRAIEVKRLVLVCPLSQIA